MNDAVRAIYIALLSKGWFGHFRIDEVEETQNKVALLKASSLGSTTTAMNANGDIFPLSGGDIYASYKSYKIKMSKLADKGEIVREDVTLYPAIMGFKNYLAGKHGS